MRAPGAGAVRRLRLIAVAATLALTIGAAEARAATQLLTGPLAAGGTREVH
jgi:hypothetical protein